MSASNISLQFHKKNGAIHWRKCAEYYGAKTGRTAREWYRCGAPIDDPEKMRTWLQAREDERLKKIAARNRRYLPNEPDIIRLYVEEKLGTRAISKYFSGRPTSPGVREILIRNGVYHGEETYQRQIRDSEERKARHLKDERELKRERKHRLAVCLWGLRKGMGVETTCKQNGWSKANIWNYLARRKSYRKFKAHRKTKWPDKRSSGKHYSRKFPSEAVFQGVIEGIVKNAGVRFVSQARLCDAMTRVDIKLEDGTFVELKVALNARGSYEFIGQAFHYRKHAKRIILCIPSDIEFRRDLYELIVELGVIVCNEETIAAVLDGELPLVAANHVIAQRASRFVCKCCGSREKRRHRSNSYCVECAPSIREMTFDCPSDRWIKLAE